ncbi:hypothetical protein Tco_0154961 [Tanacetum coccineum]
MEAHLAPTQPTQVNKITTSCEIYSGPHDTQYCMEDLEQAFVEYASSRTDESRNRQLTSNQGPRSFNKAANSWKENLNFNWAHKQTFTSPQNGSFYTYSSNHQTKLEKALVDFEAHQEKRLSSLRTQLEQQQDNMIRGPTAQMNFTSIDYHTKEELKSKGIKSRSKLLSPEYLSQSSIIKQNKNPSSPKRVHFINLMVILNKENEAEEESSVEPSKTNYTNDENANDTDEEVKSEKEVEEETKGEIEEEEEDNLEHFDTFPTMKELRLEPRRKPSNPKKNYNFVGRVKGLRVFVGNFTYECDFMVLEDMTSVIDHYLRSVVSGKPFVEATGLVYNKEEGTVVFERDKERITFKMPHKMDMFKHVDFTDRGTDSIPPFIIESDDDKLLSLVLTNKLIKNEEEIFTDARGGVRIYPGGVASPAIDSLFLTPLFCDDIHDVTPRVSALAGCDRLVSEPLVIENYVSHIRKKFCWGTIFPIGLKRYRDSKEEPIEKEPLMELMEIG